VALVWLEVDRAERYPHQQFLTKTEDGFWSSVENEVEPKSLSGVVRVERTRFWQNLKWFGAEIK
jgi:hypothetical protein